MLQLLRRFGWKTYADIESIHVQLSHSTSSHTITRWR